MDLVALVTSMPFAVATGVEIDAATAELVRGRLAWAPERCTTGGLLHGGAVDDAGRQRRRGLRVPQPS